MLKSYLKQNNILHSKSWLCVALFSLFLTIFLGSILRWSYAGYPMEVLTQFDLRRAHSHLGFYGFLFPFLWYKLKDQNLWIPSGYWIAIYFLCLIISILGFAIAGYSMVSNIFSLCILVFWILFACYNWKKLSVFSDEWLAVIPISIFISAIVICFVAFSAATGNSEISKQFVRVFLVSLAFGVFVPTAIKEVCPKSPIALIWFLFVCGFGIFISDLTKTIYFFWGPLGLGYLILKSILLNRSTIFTLKKKRLATYWTIIGFSMIFYGITIIKNTHFSAVAGIHLLILGPIMMTFLPLKKPALQIIYDVSVLGMVSAIFFQGIFTQYYLSLQSIAAGTGSIIAVILFGNVIYYFKNTYCSHSPCK